MKNKRFLALLTLTMIVTFTFQTLYVQAIVSSNIITNPGFESGMTGWSPKHVGNATPDRILGTTGGSATVVNGGRSGAKSLRVSQGNQIEGGSLTYWARSEYQFLPKETPKVGSAYLYSVWIKAESMPTLSIPPSVQLTLGVYATNTAEEYSHYQDEVITSGILTNSWQKYTGVTRMMSFEQQDGPNTQFKGLIGFHSSPKYPGANPGFDEGIKQSASLKEFYAYAILAPGPNVAIPLLIDDAEVLKPVYSFIFSTENADSKLLYKESGSNVFIFNDTTTAVYREAVEDAFFIYKLDFNASASDAILSMNLADDYKIEIGSSSNGPWTIAAIGKKYKGANAYKADEIIDLAKYLKKNSENSVYVKFSDNTKGKTGLAINGLKIRALEIFSKTGEMEFKLAALPTPTKGATSTTTSSKPASTASNSTTTSEPGTSTLSDTSAAESSTIASTESGTSETSISTVSNDGVVVDISVIKSLYTDITIDYTTKIVKIQNKLTVKDLKESFKLGEGYTITINDKSAKEITDGTKAVNDDMRIGILKNGEKYTELAIDAPSAASSTPIIIGGIIVLLLAAATTLFILFKKRIIFKK